MVGIEIPDQAIIRLWVYIIAIRIIIITISIIASGRLVKRGGRRTTQSDTAAAVLHQIAAWHFTGNICRIRCE